MKQVMGAKILYKAFLRIIMVQEILTVFWIFGEEFFYFEIIIIIIIMVAHAHLDQAHTTFWYYDTITSY